MLHGYQNNRVSLSFPKFFFHIANRIGIICDSVRQSILKVIRRDNNYTHVNMAILQIISDMNNIPCKKVTATGNLDLNSHPGFKSQVASEPHNPTNIATIRLNPVGIILEVSIDHLSYHVGAIPLLLILYPDFCP